VVRGLLLAAALAALPAAAQERFITLSSTTSTEQSGLFGELLPKFRAASGIAVRVVAVGTGQALRLGERGDADVVLVHDEASELAFVAAGFGIERKPAMYNDFVLVGPTPVGSPRDAVASFRDLAGRPFVSRGDDSGTHKAELRLWQAAGIDPKSGTGRWYRETGSGMGATLNMAAALDAYTLADRASWASFGNRRGLTIASAGDPKLFNPYGVMLVNPVRHPHVKAAEGRAFIAWLTGAEGRAAIAAFRVGGQQIFFPLPAAPAPRS